MYGSNASCGPTEASATFRSCGSLDPVFGLDAQAVKAASQWSSSAGTRLGELVPVLITIDLTFSFRDDSRTITERR
jgi:hypothetical protein